MSREIKNLDPETAYRLAKLEQACFALGLHIFLIEGDRPDAKQAKLYAKGRTTPGPIVTHAKPGQSWHSAKKGVFPASRALCLGLRKQYHNDQRPNYKSWDADPPERVLRLIADMAVQMGFEAGYYWPGKKKDPMHIEYHPGFVRLRRFPLENQISNYCEGNS